MLHPLELTCINFIHECRDSLLDVFFKFLNFFDRQEFFFVLIPVIWLGQGWKTGLRLFYILFLSNLVNHAAKEFFQLPRPFHLNPSLGLVDVAGYGLPSGAAQTAVLLSGLLLNTWKSHWKWIVAALYIALISFSRMYLGVHFPSDIIVGWVMGAGLWAFYTYVCIPLESRLERLRPFFLLVLSQCAPLLLLFWQYSLPIVRACSVAMGVGIGSFIAWSCQLMLHPIKNFRQYALRGLVGALGMFICYALTLLMPTTGSLLFIFPQFLVMGLWVSLCIPKMIQKLAL